MLYVCYHLAIHYLLNKEILNLKQLLIDEKLNKPLKMLFLQRNIYHIRVMK